MNSLEIPWRGIYKQYAGAWDEIEAKDAPYIGKCLYWLERGEIDVDMFRKLVVDRLIGRVNDKVFRLSGIAAENVWANEGLLADTVEFFFKKEEKDGRLQYEVIPNFIKNLLPTVGGWWNRVYGPGDFLGDMSFGEYKDLLFCADKYMKSHDEEWLTRMMAIGYRRRRFGLWFKRRLSDYDGRIRVRYSAGATDFRMRRFKNIDIGAKYIFFEYLMGCVYTMRNDNEGQGIDVDGNVCYFSLMFNRKKSGDGLAEDDEDNSIGLTGVLMALAESGVFGNIADTARADVWDVLVRLYQLELQRRDLEQKIKR